MKEIKDERGCLNGLGMLLAGCGNDVVTETGWEAEYITVEYRAEGSECEGSSIRKDIGKKDATLIAVLDFGSRNIHTR